MRTLKLAVAAAIDEMREIARAGDPQERLPKEFQLTAANVSMLPSVIPVDHPSTGFGQRRALGRLLIDDFLRRGLPFDHALPALGHTN
jgi:hypothetical protein